MASMFIGNYFHGTEHAGINDANSSNGRFWTIIGNTFSGNTYGVRTQASGCDEITITGNNFYNSINDGVNLNNGSTCSYPNLVYNNIFYGNGAYGVNLFRYAPNQRGHRPERLRRERHRTFQQFRRWNWRRDPDR